MRERRDEDTTYSQINGKEMKTLQKKLKKGKVR